MKPIVPLPMPQWSTLGAEVRPVGDVAVVPAQLPVPSAKWGGDVSVTIPLILHPAPADRAAPAAASDCDAMYLTGAALFTGEAPDSITAQANSSPPLYIIGLLILVVYATRTLSRHLVRAGEFRRVARALSRHQPPLHTIHATNYAHRLVERYASFDELVAWVADFRGTSGQFEEHVECTYEFLESAVLNDGVVNANEVLQHLPTSDVRQTWKLLAEQGWKLEFVPRARWVEEHPVNHLKKTLYLPIGLHYEDWRLALARVVNTKILYERSEACRPALLARVEERLYAQRVQGPFAAALVDQCLRYLMTLHLERANVDFYRTLLASGRCFRSHYYETRADNIEDLDDLIGMQLVIDPDIIEALRGLKLEELLAGLEEGP